MSVRPSVSMATSTWGTCRGHDGMPPPKFHPNRSIDRQVIAFPTFCNTAAVRHLEFCYSGSPTKSTMRFDYPVKIWYRSDIHRRRYYNFIILPVWRGAFPQICKILRFCDFFVVLSCAVLVMLFFLVTPPRSNPWTDFNHIWLK